MKKVLVVDDEPSILTLLTFNLEKEGYQVTTSENGKNGFELALSNQYDFIILDVMLPGINGFQVCEALRKDMPDIGIIMLTAKDQDMDKIMGLEYGADDYVIKPFNPVELILRAKALLRRIEGNLEDEEDIINFPPFKLDLYSQKLLKNDIEIDITPKEYMMFRIFIENPGKAFSRDELLNLVWGYDFVGDPKIVDVNIRRLRAKIEDDSSNPRFIETVWGTGYRWKK